MAKEFPQDSLNFLPIAKENLPSFVTHISISGMKCLERSTEAWGQKLWFSDIFIRTDVSYDTSVSRTCLDHRHWIDYSNRSVYLWHHVVYTLVSMFLLYR